MGAGDPADVIVGGRFRVVARIGSGQASEVFEAVDVDTGEAVALKVLSPAQALLDEARARFVKECEIMSRIDHPHVLKVVHRASLDDGMVFFATELADHHALDVYLQQVGGMSAAEALRLCSQLLRALQDIHGMGVIHRDIKPSNILMFAGPTPKLADFGIAQDAHSRRTRVGDDLGTPNFMPPEQALDPSSVDPTADLYALATTLYWMLTGAKPVALVSPGYRERALAALPGYLRGIVERATRPFPVDRYASAHEMLAEVDAALTLALADTP